MRYWMLSTVMTTAASAQDAIPTLQNGGEFVTSILEFGWLGIVALVLVLLFLLAAYYIRKRSQIDMAAHIQGIEDSQEEITRSLWTIAQSLVSSCPRFTNLERQLNRRKTSQDRQPSDERRG